VSLLSSDWGTFQARSYAIIRKIQYAAFLDEYLSLGHVCLKPSIAEESILFYLPHHYVFKTSKIRIVFDASCRSSGELLNDALLVGPGSTRFDLNFNALPFFHLCHHCLYYKNVSADFSASRRACREFSGATISLQMSIRTNSLPSLTVQLRVTWF